MTTLTLDLPTDVFARLKQRAAGAGKPIETVASELLVEQMSQPRPERRTEREAIWDILRDAGLLAELTQSEQQRGLRPTCRWMRLARPSMARASLI